MPDYQIGTPVGVVYSGRLHYGRIRRIVRHSDPSARIPSQGMYDVTFNRTNTATNIITTGTSMTRVFLHRQVFPVEQLVNDTIEQTGTPTPDISTETVDNNDDNTPVASETVPSVSDAANNIYQGLYGQLRRRATPGITNNYISEFHQVFAEQTRILDVINGEEEEEEEEEPETPPEIFPVNAPYHETGISATHVENRQRILVTNNFEFRTLVSRSSYTPEFSDTAHLFSFSSIDSDPQHPLVFIPYLKTDNTYGYFTQHDGRWTEWINDYSGHGRLPTNSDVPIVRDAFNVTWLRKADLNRATITNRLPTWSAQITSGRLTLAGTKTKTKSGKRLYRKRPMPDIKDEKHYANKTYIA